MYDVAYVLNTLAVIVRAWSNYLISIYFQNVHFQLCIFVLVYYFPSCKTI